MERHRHVSDCHITAASLIKGAMEESGISRTLAQYAVFFPGEMENVPHRSPKMKKNKNKSAASKKSAVVAFGVAAVLGKEHFNPNADFYIINGEKIPRAEFFQQA